MKRHYVSIEKDTETFELYKRLWKEHGIEGIRVGSMMEGIERAVEIEQSSNELFFISIVADDINFLPQLKILREETNVPILVAASKAHYSESEHHEALKCGADFYATFCESPATDINGVFSAIRSINRRTTMLRTPNTRMSHGDIHVVVEHHKVFVKDEEIVLTCTEMKILQYLMSNGGQVLSHKGIASLLCERDNGETTPNVIYSTMKRLRKKIRDAAQVDYIETIRDVGYRLITKEGVV
jgi:DNA-binding response OmpR family regulator